MLAIMAYGITTAQDARNRTTSTIIADALAQLPAATQQEYNHIMAELASTGKEGLAQIAGMLSPSEKGENAKVEYALHGLTAYLHAEGEETRRDALRQALKEAIDNSTDNPNRAFLMTLLQRCGKAEDGAFFAKYVPDPYLMEWAVNGLIAIDGTEDVLMGLIEAGAPPRDVLAYAAGKKGLAAAEPAILDWCAETRGSDARPYYKALGAIGSKKSLPILSKAAKAQQYGWEADGATEAYVALIGRLAANGDAKTAVDEAKRLMKATDKANIRGAAMQVIFETEGKKALPLLVKALKSPDRAYRVNALRLAEPWADEEVYATIAKTLDGKDNYDTKTDIINWLGTNHVESRIEPIIAQFDSPDPETASAAFKAAGKIGGSKALEALCKRLGSDKSEDASTALLHFNGDVSPGILKALQGYTPMKVAAMKVAATRHINDAAPKIFALLDSEDAAVRETALATLAGVAGANDFDKICTIIEEKGTAASPALGKALLSSAARLPQDQAFSKTMKYLAASKIPQMYYPVLALCGTGEAISHLHKAYSENTGPAKEAALQAMAKVNDSKMADILYEIAVTDDRPDLLPRYAELVDLGGYTPEHKYIMYRKGLDAATDPSAKRLMLRGLASAGTYQALMLADSCQADPAISKTAAEAVRGIMAKNLGTYSGAPVREALERAREIYKAGGSADDGYAMDDINGMLSRLGSATVTPEYQLTPEEKAEGFKVLFDGRSMENFTGNLTDYIPVDGNIYVTATYGNGGNLYTKEEYGDFIFRFEFCFEKEGVNNGIGIRTPMGVDAAYEGMEIQVLDHDAPIYKGLRDYQVHGSVYGIIPAKRIKHKPLGEWSTEEIRVVGDRITVTVNDEVILDGNIRKACQGHNTAPDGSDTNPYTVDHLNHPGLFNKKGHVGFLGHGSGIKFRNIPIKRL